MAIKLIGNYAKRLGLPGYSSHQFSVSVETELTDSGNIQGEAARIYQLLQDAVDREIQQTGFVPAKDYGTAPSDQNGGNASHNRLQGVAGTTAGSNGTNGNHGAHSTNGANGNHGSNGGGSWACSDKQQELILSLVTENNISRKAVDNTAHDRFGVGVKELNKLQASGLITELLETTGKVSGGRNGASKRKGGGQ